MNRVYFENYEIHVLITWAINIEFKSTTTTISKQKQKIKINFKSMNLRVESHSSIYSCWYFSIIEMWVLFKII